MSQGKIVFHYMNSPVGRLLLVRSKRGIEKIGFEGMYTPDPDWIRDGSALGDVITQLNSYFSGRLKKFTLPFTLRGTEFQLAVWEALLQISYGETISYGEQARLIGKPNAARAVGAANGKNPLSIVVPCHRVVGRNSALTGFGGGLDIKAKLLTLEKAHR